MSRNRSWLRLLSMKTNISTFLWFDNKAIEAAKLYCEIVPGAKLTSSSPMSASFEIGDQRYIAFNGGSHYKLTPAVSLMIQVDTQADIDALWSSFIKSGGTESQCGWLVDKFGLSWQIIPKQLLSLISDKDPAKAKRATDAMLQMGKIDLAAIQRAHQG
jgi:predicted 3-demethylubiquinone-9 3-methyltransferase (glyoxalase superfamily)